ncbi:MAG: hypothetical protein IKR57_01085 [Bacilli bacterium]|nr:hypothetical protein [Bacilli bacterium]
MNRLLLKELNNEKLVKKVLKAKERHRRLVQLHELKRARANVLLRQELQERQNELKLKL